MTDPTTKSLRDLMSNDFVTLHIGAKKEPWSLHLTVLCTRSSFFREKLTGLSRQGKVEREDEEATNFPGIDPTIFSALIGPLYTGLLPPIDSQTANEELLKLYLLSCDLHIEYVQNAILSHVHAASATKCFTYPSRNTLAHFYANTNPSTPLRRLYIGNAVFNFLHGHRHSEFIDLMIGKTRFSVEFRREFLSEMGRVLKGGFSIHAPRPGWEKYAKVSEASGDTNSAATSAASPSSTMNASPTASNRMRTVTFGSSPEGSTTDSEDWSAQGKEGGHGTVKDIIAKNGTLEFPNSLLTREEYTDILKTVENAKGAATPEASPSSPKNGNPTALHKELDKMKTVRFLSSPPTPKTGLFLGKEWVDDPGEFHLSAASKALPPTRAGWKEHANVSKASENANSASTPEASPGTCKNDRLSGTIKTVSLLSSPTIPNTDLPNGKKPKGKKKGMA
ncbi:MAG: hypothetical protein M1827_003708 [Pycnora praestabilis]|nr:MAG: hypothetical protein M1827_003708 [Pycnora praestabilis]